MNSKFKVLIPHVVAIAVFIGLASMYFSPLFEGNALRQSDVKQFQGMAKEIVDYRLMNDGKEPLWTNSMFGGMPAYQISVAHDSNVLIYVDRMMKLGLPTPVGILFVAMLGFYIFALCLRVNPWLGILGAIAFGFSSINILYIAGGHITKVNAIIYMAPALGGMILAFRGKWLLGSGIFALFLGLNITANHLQMTYYLAFLLVAVAIGESIRLLIQKEILTLGKTIGALALATVFGILPSASNLLTTLEYSEYTTRGTTDLTIKPKNPTNVQEKEGLNKNYILEYNFGPGEFLSILAPNAKGERGDYLGNDEAAMENVDSQYAQQIAQMNRYWGGQSFTGGAFYFGAFMIALFLLGLILLKDNLKWPFLAISILVILLASNDPGGINDFFINKFPMYNKFRDSKMILVLLQVMIPALGVLFLDRFFKKEGIIGDKKIWLYATGGVTFLIAILYIIPSLSGSFISADEVKMFAQAAKSQDPNQVTFVNGLKNALIETRIGLYKGDMGRALLLVILACGIVLASVYTKLSHFVFTGIAIAIVAFDNISVSKRYLNNEEEGGVYKSYEPIDAAAFPTLPSLADNRILSNEIGTVANFSAKISELQSKMLESIQYKQITDEQTRRAIAAFGVLNLNTDYRVLSFSNPFAETTTSYFHKSIGGYHGAKLKRYQEIADFYVFDELNRINREIGMAKNVKLQAYGMTGIVTNENAKQVFDTIQIDEIAVSDSNAVLNMLNTKYLIVDRTKNPVKNTNANGAAWFVGTVKMVNSSNDEMKALEGLNSKNEAIFNTKDFPSIAMKKAYEKDSTASIKLTSYGTDVLKYSSNSRTELPAIFSEVYYPKGWNCYVDGKQIETFRANYILRGAIIPAGKHTIEWRFEPESYAKGSSYASIFSILTLLLFFGVTGLELKNKFVSSEKES
ncbi:MAG: YfhO family protein [Flavobacteriales bacterium]|nr:YfhO family protein [Flavobacteriales bacterium]